MEQNASAAPAADDGKGIPADMVEEAAPAGEVAAPDEATAREQDLARRLGWRPEGEFRGPQHKWMSAADFIKKTETEVPLLRSQLRRMAEKDEQKDRLLKEQGDALKELLDRSRGAEARGFEYALERVDAEMEEAVKNADHEGYKRLKHQREELVKMKPAPKEAKKADDNPRREAPAPDPDVLAWSQQNQWFFSDKKLKGIARGLEEALLEDEPHLSTSDRLAKVTEEVKRRYPEKFENAARGNPPAAARPGPQGVRPAAKKAKTEADLPPSARAVMERLVNQKVLTKEQYIKDYKWDK